MPDEPTTPRTILREPQFIFSLWITGQFFVLIVLFGMKWLVLEPQLESTVIQTYVVAFTASWGYWLGTSASSKGKDDVIAKQLGGKP